MSAVVSEKHVVMEEEQKYLENVQSVVAMVLDKSVMAPFGHVSEEIFDVEKHFRKLVGTAKLISEKLNNIVNKVHINENFITESDNEHDTVDFDIDNIFKNLNDIFNASIFDNIEEQDPLLFISEGQNKSDTEKLLEDEHQRANTAHISEYGSTLEDETCEIYSGNLKRSRLEISPLRNLRLKDESSHRIRCDECSFETKSIRYLNKHKRTEHSEFEFFCPFCSFTTEKKRSMMSHINRQHPLKNCSFAN